MGYSSGYDAGKADGQEEGYSSGYDSGKQDGQSEGYSSGYDAGKADGQEEGYNDGYADGYADGEEGASAGDYEEGYYANEPIFNFHTDLQSQFLNGSSLSVPDSITGLEENSKPASVVIFADDDARYENKDVTKYVLKLSESKTMTDAREIESPTKRFDLKGLNLDIGTRYFYTTVAVTSKGNFESGVKSFSTSSQAPRNLDIDGVTNCRDVGGWDIEGTSNKTVQNLFYRTARLHDDYIANVTDAGKKELKRLGIKTEIDLRDPVSSGLTALSSALDGVDYYNCGMLGSNYFTNETDLEGIRKTFDVLSDVTNYPLLFHCSIGTDRTGFIAFLIDCLAGVSVEDMCKDYVFSCFGNINGLRQASTIQGYVAKLNSEYNANGDYALGATNFLKSIGVTTGEIEVVKDMITVGHDTHSHNESEDWVPSHLNPGRYHEKVCTDPDCGIVASKEEHNFGEMTVEVAPTLTTPGEGHHACVDCGYYKEEVLPKLGTDSSYIGMHTYGNATSFTIQVDGKPDNIDGELTDLTLYKEDGTALTGVTYTYNKDASEDYSTIQFHLSSALSSGEVITLKKGSVFSDGTHHYVLDQPIYLTYNGSKFYPSFLLNGGYKKCRKASSADGSITTPIHIELEADFRELRLGSMKSGTQPYYTKNRGSNFNYTVTRGGSLIKTYNCDYVDDVHATSEIKTSMHFSSIMILRITMEKTLYQNGDIFCIKKGSSYADDGKQTSRIDPIRMYILEKDLTFRFNGSTMLFEFVE